MIPEESEQFRFLRAASFDNVKGSVGLILAKASTMRISIPLDLSSRSFTPLYRGVRGRCYERLISKTTGSKSHSHTGWSCASGDLGIGTKIRGSPLIATTEHATAQPLSSYRPKDRDEDKRQEV
jgi:hypothetical protein